MRFFFSLVLFCQILFGVNFVYPDFTKGYNENIKSIVNIGDIKAIAVSKHYAISYQKKKPDVKYVKYDPFLNLYLFYSKKELSPIQFKNTDKLVLGEWIASVSEDSLYIGNFARRGNGIDKPYLQNSKVKPNSIIICLCNRVYGIGIGNNQFISSKLIKRFIKSKEIYYGSIGARFKKVGQEIVVTSINPFHSHNGLMIGDIIRKIDAKRLNNLDDLNKGILFSVENRTVEVEFTRDGVFKKKKFKIYKRKGGGILSDTFLEDKGIYFDKELKIIKVLPDSIAFKNGLKIGDRLLEIGGKSVKNQDDIKLNLSKSHKKDIYLLFDRNDFQFFSKISL